MTTVQLTKFWITNTVTGESFGAQSSQDRSKVASVTGEVRRYAGGRMRAIGSPGLATSWKVSLVELTQANIDTLQSWMQLGVTVLAKDHRGQSMYGTYFAMEVTEHVSGTYANARYNVTIEFQRVDVVEGIV